MPTRIGQDSFSLMDFTSEVNKIPRPWSLLTDTLQVEENSVETTTVTVDVVQENTSTFKDSVRGGERNKMKSETAETKAFVVPFFTLDASITARDYQNLRKWGTDSDTTKLDDLRLRIMTRARRNHGALKEKIFAEMLQGRAYAPNGYTSAYNYYTEFGATQESIDFDLGTAGTDVLGKAEGAWGHIIDNAQDNATAYDVICYAGATWFQKFISHPKVSGAYEQYASSINPNRERPNGGATTREFVHGSVKYIEYRGAFDGSFLFPQDEAFFVPVGIEGMFEVDYAPSDLVDRGNEAGQEMYMIEERDHRRVNIETECAIIGINKRPELVVKATTST